MDRYSSRRNITEILLKTALNTIQSFIFNYLSLVTRRPNSVNTYNNCFVVQDYSFSTRFKSDQKKDYLKALSQLFIKCNEYLLCKPF